MPHSISACYQGLNHHGLLDMIDYLSTVSGGGYIGGWWYAWKQRIRHMWVSNFPRCHLPVGCGGTGASSEPDEIRHLREFSNFLVPLLGFFDVDMWYGTSRFSSGILPTLFMAISLLGLTCLFWLLSYLLFGTFRLRAVASRYCCPYRVISVDRSLAPSFWHCWRSSSVWIREVVAQAVWDSTRESRYWHPGPAPVFGCRGGCCIPRPIFSYRVGCHSYVGASMNSGGCRFRGRPEAASILRFCLQLRLGLPQQRSCWSSGTFSPGSILRRDNCRQHCRQLPRDWSAVGTRDHLDADLRGLGGGPRISTIHLWVWLACFGLRKHRDHGH